MPTGVAAVLALATGVSRPARGQVAACTPVSLRDALERIASTAGVRLSYSRELIPIDRLVCPPTPGQPALAALTALLSGSGIDAIAVGGQQIVLAPAAHTGDGAAVASRAAVLDRVIVTGSPVGAPSRGLPVALSVVDGTTLGARAGISLASALDGAVPGLWVWTQPTTSLLARYAGLRGASSFGVTTPKLYLDGVEVANPLVVSALTSDQIERVEVIRGPQGAALYGADAISGVINVITRHDGAASGGRTLTLRSGVGATATAFAEGPAFTQDHGLTLRAGSGPRTGGLSVGFTTIGPVVPGRTAHQLTALGDARLVGRSGVLTLTARVADVGAAASDTLLIARTATGTLGASLAGPAGPTSVGGAVSSPDQHLTEVTLAATGVRATGGRWTQTVTAGVDGYRIAGVASTDPAALPLPLDSAQHFTRGTAARGTLRASTTATYDVARDLALTVTGIADYGLLHDATRPDDLLSATTVTPLSPGAPPVGYFFATPPSTWLGTAGIVGQTTLAWRDALFVTAGLRGERNDGFTGDARTALLPSLGISAVRPVGGATLKLRAAYGSGLRPVRSAARQMAWHAVGGVLSGALDPESQRGVEAGADLFMGNDAGDARQGATLALHVTAFDQLASSLLQQVAQPRGYGPGTIGGWPTRSVAAQGSPSTIGLRHDASARRPLYTLQNAGAIRNRGFESEAQVRTVASRAGTLTLAGSLAYVNSRVERTAYGYTGDLRTGDRVLEVPRWTLGATAAWRTPSWNATLGVARAADWVNYDRVALVGAVRAGAAEASLTGRGLRSYWREYPGVTRLRADVSRDLARGLALVLTGENLLDRQQGEPDNLTVLPGRTLTAGVRAHF